MPKAQANPFEGLFTERHYQDCQRCVQNADYLGQLLDKADKTGMDVAPAREIRERQLERIKSYLAEFFPDRTG